MPLAILACLSLWSHVIMFSKSEAVVWNVGSIYIHSKYLAPGLGHIKLEVSTGGPDGCCSSAILRLEHSSSHSLESLSTGCLSPLIKGQSNSMKYATEKHFESVLTETKNFQQDLEKVAANRDQNKSLQAYLSSACCYNIPRPFSAHILFKGQKKFPVQIPKISTGYFSKMPH